MPTLNGRGDGQRKKAAPKGDDPKYRVEEYPKIRPPQAIRLADLAEDPRWLRYTFREARCSRRSVKPKYSATVRPWRKYHHGPGETRAYQESRGLHPEYAPLGLTLGPIDRLGVSLLALEVNRPWNAPAAARLPMILGGLDYEAPLGAWFSLFAVPLDCEPARAWSQSLDNCEIKLRRRGFAPLTPEAADPANVIPVLSESDFFEFREAFDAMRTMGGSYA